MLCSLSSSNRQLITLCCRVHTILHQVGGATGRINSSHPNLQNLPMHDPRAADIRRAFNCPSEGHVLVSADYSQVELRVLAALCGDQALQEALKGDVHSATARVLLQKGPEVCVCICACVYVPEEKDDSSHFVSSRLFARCHSICCTRTEVASTPLEDAQRCD